MAPKTLASALVVAALLSTTGCKLLKKKEAVVDAGAFPAAASDEVDAGAPAAATTADAATTAAVTATTHPAAPQCKLALKVAQLHSSGGITDPDLQQGSTSTLTFPCTGGAAHAAFGKHVFTGTADKTHVHVVASSTYTAFNCPWKTEQTISGTPPTLTYAYTEAVVPPCKTHAHPSTMNGTVTAE